VEEVRTPQGAPPLFWHPSRVLNNFPLPTGGLRYASTTGYYLTALRAKERESKSLPRKGYRDRLKTPALSAKGAKCNSLGLFPVKNSP
jgi:hypothetical protein